MWLSDWLASTTFSYDLSIRTRRLKQAASLIAHGRLIHPAHVAPAQSLQAGACRRR
jgi:hypothetical protein